ncbi:MAG: hypothetical protein EXR66_00660 [Dehalococcoidia bacterium]|nr:hypothetical protein [Dehalococcoidia bacterium]
MTIGGGPAFLFGHGLPNVLPLAGLHIELGCHPGPAHGYTVPLWYVSPLDEQVATRSGAGLFDRSYLGQHYVTGERAAEVLGAVLATDPARVPVGSVTRAIACREDSTVLDLPLLAHLDEGRWFLLCGAGGHELAHAIEAAGEAVGVQVHDRSMYVAVLSLQGPRARDVAADVLGRELVDTVSRGHTREFLFGLHRAALFGASDVGEDGLVLVVEPGTAADAWRALVAAGATSAGLAAHDALRLEAGTLEAPRETPRPATPYAAGLQELVHLDDLEGGARTFTGSGALLAAKPPERRLAALRLDGPRLAKPGSRVRVAGFDIGACVAAGWSSVLDAPLALAYLAPALDTLEVDCAGIWQRATRVTIPLASLAT